MIFSPMNNANSSTLTNVQSPSFNRKRNLPTPPPSLSDVNDSSSCSSSSSASSSSLNDSQSSVNSCDLLNILTDARFRPVFQAIEEIKRRKCRPDLDRILKYVEKRSLSYQRDEIILMLDDLLKYGLITKVFHKGGFTIRIKNDKYAKLIENMNLCCNQKATTTNNMTSTDSTWPNAKPSILNSNEMNNHRRETPSPEFAESSSTNDSNKSHVTTKENKLNSNKKRPRNRTSPSPSNTNKRTRLPSQLSDPSSIEPIFRKPFLNNDNHLPPVTIEQLLGLRGDIPDVHNWTTEDLIEFFDQQGYEYARNVLVQHHINGNQLYELKREEIFRISTLKIGKSLKLWNIIEQIQRNNPLSSSCTK